MMSVSSAHRDPELMPIREQAAQWLVQRLRRYRAGAVAMDDTLAERSLHFTGVLPADDSDAALALLTDALDLKLSRYTPWYMRLEAKE